MYFVSNNGLKVKYNSYWKKFLLPPAQSLVYYDAKQVALGIDIEMEHTNNPEIALYIVLHHLDEIPDYYSRLLKMEEEAGEYWGE